MLCLAKTARASANVVGSGTVGPDAIATLRTVRSSAPDIDKALAIATGLMPELQAIGTQAVTQLQCVRPYTPDIVAFFSNWADWLSYTDGKDRYGLAHKRPAALVDLPRFNGDQLIAQKCGGDLFVQACANDAQVAFHAVRQLARQGYGILTMRWGQAGFLSGLRAQTPRNLMGFKDGTRQPDKIDETVWVGPEGVFVAGVRDADDQ